MDVLPPFLPAHAYTPHCRAVLETCLVNDVTGNLEAVDRAQSLLERLKRYIHADGAGLPAEHLEKSSAALALTIRASLT